MIHHLPSLQTSTLFTIQVSNLSWWYSREAGLCSTHNFKVHPLLLFPPYFSIPHFLYLYSFFSLHCSINIFLSFLFSPLFAIPHLSAPLSSPALSLTFFFTPSISLQVNPTSPNTSKAGCLPLMWWSFIPEAWLEGRLYAKARYSHGM